MHNPTRIYFFVISLVTQLNPALELHSRGGIQLAPYRPIFLATHHITRTNSEKKPVVEHRQILGSSFTSFSRPLSGRMASGKHKVGKRKSTNLFPILQNSGLNFYTRLLLLFLLGALPCLAARYDGNVLPSLVLCVSPPSLIHCPSTTACNAPGWYSAYTHKTRYADGNSFLLLAYFKCIL